MGLERKSVRGILCDIHGVLYTHPRVLEGSVEAVTRLRASGLPFLFLTNSTQFPKRHVLETLRRGGFPLEARDLMTAPEAAAAHLAAGGFRRVGWLAARDLAEDIPGVAPVDPVGPDDAPVDAVLVGDLGERFTFAALNRGFRWLRDGAALVALTRARYYQAADGLRLDSGPFVKLLEEASSVEATVVGKPSEAFFRAGLARLGLPAGDTLMVGDDLAFDVVPAMNLGMQGVLVQSGKYRERSYEASPRKPDELETNLLAVVERLGL